jgi:hypothetical protein
MRAVLRRCVAQRATRINQRGASADFSTAIKHIAHNSCAADGIFPHRNRCAPRMIDFTSTDVHQPHRVKPRHSISKNPDGINKQWYRDPIPAESKARRK